MHLYRIGPAKGAQRIGLARDPEAVLARMRAQSEEGLTIRTWDLPTGQAQLVERLIHVQNMRNFKGVGWFDCLQNSLDFAIDSAIALTGSEGIEQHAVCDREGYARAMKHLRMEVFQTTQEMIGAIVGLTAGRISRWETGAATPGLDELLKLRAYARALGLPWEDRLLLDPPAA